MKTLIKILLPCFLLTACTQVELCPEEEHPHSSLVHVDLGFDGLDLVTNEEYKPKSVQVIASRVVNTWRSEFTLPLSTDDNSDTRFEEGVSGEETGHRLKSGEYTFFFVGLNETYYDVEGLDDYINDYHNGMRNLSLKVKKEDVKDIPELDQKDWVDFNPGVPFINYKGPIFKDQQHNVSLYTGQTATVYAKLQPVTQKISVDFKIRKDANVRINSVICELSGIVTRMRLLNNVLDTEDLGRIVFRTDYDKNVAQDDLLSCRETFEVLGIIGSQSPKRITGPGILQIAIYVTVGENTERVLSGGINLYQSIMDAGLTKTVKDGNNEYTVIAKPEGMLEITQELRIDGDKIIQWGEEDGFDTWFPAPEEDDPKVEV